MIDYAQVIMTQENNVAKEKKETGFKTTLNQERDTKRFLVYKNEDGPIPSLYIGKDAFDGEPPKSITVTVSEA